MNEVFFNLKGFFQVSHEVSASDVGKIYLEMSLEGEKVWNEARKRTEINLNYQPGKKNLARPDIHSKISFRH